MSASADYKTAKLYDAAINKVTASGQVWKDICKLTGQLYCYEFDNILMVYMQKPKAKLVADYDTWKKVKRYVMRGSKGIAIFPSRALKPYMRYVFDISDTGGKKSRLTWELNEDTKVHYSEWLRKKENINLPEEKSKQSNESFLKAFTENRIRVIMDTDFREQITEFLDLTGNRKINASKASDNDNENDKAQEITMQEALERSVMYAVFTRCNFEFPMEKQDFSFITAFTKEEEIHRFGILFNDISCEVLKSIAKDLTQMERSLANGRNKDNVSRGSGWNALSEYSSTRGNSENDTVRQIRSEGNGIPQREPQRTI